MTPGTFAVVEIMSDYTIGLRAGGFTSQSDAQAAMESAEHTAFGVGFMVIATAGERWLVEKRPASDVRDEVPT